MSLQKTARRFILKTKVNLSKQRGNEMMIVTFGYTDYVVPTKDAVTFLELLANAERYEERYVSKDDKSNTSGEAYHTYHVYANDSTVSAKTISDEKYRLAKLAGKPIKP